MSGYDPVLDELNPWGHGPDKFDVDGNPLTLRRWGELHENLEYMVLKQETIHVRDGKRFWISTVWLGLDHSFSRGGKPVIFETMIFTTRPGPWPEHAHRAVSGHGDVECWRWTDKTEARLGHEIAADRMRAGWMPGGDDWRVADNPATDEEASRCA